MAKAPVSICLIYRDDPLLEQAVASIRPHVAQVCIVVDDDAPAENRALAKKLADSYSPILWGPDGLDDFARARNDCMALAREALVGWMDTDDVVVGGENLARECEKLRSPTLIGGSRYKGRLLAPYDYKHDPDTGEVVAQQWRERVVPNDGMWVWMHPTHEGLYGRDGSKVDPAEDRWSQGIRWVHKRTKDGGRSRSLAILKKWYAAGHTDPWTHLNLGYELHAAGRHAEAHDHYDAHFRESGWSDERIISGLRMVDCCIAVGIRDGDKKFEVAFGALKRLVNTIPGAGDRLEVEHAKAKLHYLRAMMGGGEGDLAYVVGACKRALKAPDVKTPLAHNPRERAFEVPDLLRNAAEILRDWQTASEANEMVLAFRPNSPQHVLARKQYAARLALEAAVSSPVDDNLRVAPALDASLKPIEFDVENAIPHGAFEFDGHALPEPVEMQVKGVKPSEITLDFTLDEATQAELDRLQAEMTQVIANARLCLVQPRDPAIPKAIDVVFVCGPAPVQWDPDTVRKHGAGGSETAVVELAKRLAVMPGIGCVRVFGWPAVEGTYDGVDYIQYNPDVPPKTDVLIAWRMGAFLMHGEARVRLMWCHDTEALGMSYGLSLLADRFLALTEWHKDNLVAKHGLPESQVVVTRNGVDPAMFAGEVRGNAPRMQTKALYCSSPDRGLGALLDMWPRIRERVPNAELDVCYGFDAWEREANQRKDQQHRFLVSTLRRRMRELEPMGVRYLGRIPKKLLAYRMLTSGALLYPTWFPETSCMAVMEARAAGMRVVTSPVAGLAETAATDCVRVEGDWVSDEYRGAFIDAAVEALIAQGAGAEYLSDAWGRSTRADISRRAIEEFDWAGVARQWRQLFAQLLVEESRGRLPEYREHREPKAAE